MENFYATLADIRAGAPDSLRVHVTKYDATILRLCGDISRWIDRECKRKFYPILQTRRFAGSGECELWVPDLVSITSVEVSWDYGLSYTTLTTDDYIPTVAGDENAPESYTQLITNINSATLRYWPRGQRSIRIAGIWGRTDDRDNAFEDTGDTVQDDPLSSSALTLTVGDVDGLDSFSAFKRFQAGQLLKIESEYVETTLAIDETANTIGIVRARNRTTAAEHAQDTAISVWRPPEPIRSAAVIQVVRQMERGLQGFGDARAQPDVGQMFFFKALDPEVAKKLTHYLYQEFPH